MKKEKINTLDKNKKTYVGNKKGSILAYSLIILTMMTAIAASVSVGSVVDKKSASATEFSTQAFQVADSAVQVARKKIMANDTATLDANFFPDCTTIDGVATVPDQVMPGGAPGEYTLSFYKKDGTGVPCTDSSVKVENVRAVGTFKDTVRAVSVDFKGPCGDVSSVDYDGEIYDVVPIGSQCWMAKNLNIGTELTDGTTSPSDNDDIEKWCFSNVTTNCDTYGGLYTWAEAMGFPDECNTSLALNCGGAIAVSNHQGICPSGWHIPTNAEYKTMEVSLGMTVAQANSLSWRVTDEGTKMKTDGTSELNILLAGSNSSGSYQGQNVDGYIWSASEISSTTAQIRQLESTRDTVNNDDIEKQMGLSVRCLKD